MPISERVSTRCQTDWSREVEEREVDIQYGIHRLGGRCHRRSDDEGKTETETEKRRFRTSESHSDSPKNEVQAMKCERAVLSRIGTPLQS